MPAASSQPAARAARSVLLRHDTPDGAWHLDWLTEPPGLAHTAAGDDAPLLIAFRIAADDSTRLVWDRSPTGHASTRPPVPPIGPALAGAFTAEALPPHRLLYLRFEGPIAGGRGHVRRLAVAWVWWHTHDPANLDLSIVWAPEPARAGLLAGGPPSAPAPTADRWHGLPIGDGPRWRFTPAAAADR